MRRRYFVFGTLILRILSSMLFLANKLRREGLYFWGSQRNDNFLSEQPKKIRVGSWVITEVVIQREGMVQSLRSEPT